MASLAATIYDGKILDGNVNLYLGTARQALPTDINNTEDGTLNFAGYTLLNFKETSVKSKYTQEFTEEFVRENAAAIWAYLEKEGFELEFTMKRADLDVLQYAMAAATVSNVTATGSQVGQKILSVGGGDVNTFSLLMHLTNGEDFYRLYHYPIIMPSGDVEQEFDRAKSILAPITFKVLADFTEPAGERLMKCYDMTAALT